MGWMARRRMSAWTLAACFGAASMAFFPAATLAAESVSQPAHPEGVSPADTSSIAQRADALAAQVQQLALPQAGEIQLVTAADMSERMKQAEARFQLGEWVHCAAMLVPVLDRMQKAGSSAYGRAAYLVAESLYRSGSYALSESAYTKILNQQLAQYEKLARMRLLQIAMAQDSSDKVDTRYHALLAAYGASSDGRVYYVLAEARYYRRDYKAAIREFGRVPSTSDYYWRARYYRGVAFARRGELDDALDAFSSIESELASRDLSKTDREILELSRTGQATIYYQKKQWADAIAATSRVDKDAHIYDQALFQRAWSEIRNDELAAALDDLDFVTLISNNTHRIARARLLAANLRREDKDYDRALENFESASDNLDLIHEEIEDIRDHGGTVLDRMQDTKTILTGTMVADFDPSDWFPDDPISRRGLEILRASHDIRHWIDINETMATDMSDALSSGFAYDRAPDLRAVRGQLVDARRQSALWRAALAEAARGGSEASGNAASDVTDGALRALRRLPHNEAAYRQSVQGARAALDAQILDVYRQEQRIFQDIDNIKAKQRTLRDALRRKHVSVQDARAKNHAWMQARHADMNAVRGLRAQRRTLARKRVRYGVGEAQSAVLEASRAVTDAATKELRDASHTSGDAALALNRLDSVISQRLQTLDARVAQAWRVAYGHLQSNEADIRRLNASYHAEDHQKIQDARDVAEKGFHDMLGNVKQAALRAHLGQVDVAWWQKEDVSNRIDSLFEERERQIKRLDANFLELRK